MPAAWRGALVANCGAGTNCSAAGDAGYTPPAAAATAGARPSVLDSNGAVTAGLAAYRRIYWGWMMAGGGAVYNLDWSYTAGFEDGTKEDAQVCPGGRWGEEAGGGGRREAGGLCRGLLYSAP
jgi:hypothetical protein